MNTLFWLQVKFDKGRIETGTLMLKLSRVIEDSNQTINSLDLPAVFVSQEFKSTLELYPSHLETDQSAPPLVTVTSQTAFLRIQTKK